MGKCGAPGAELLQRRRRDLRGRAGAGPGDETGALRTATQLASAMIRVCSETGPEGSLFPVDPNLRPEGRSGPLVRTLASHLAYYQRWAKTWEFQALLKARPVAGDRGLGQDYLAALDAAGLARGAAGRLRRRRPGDAAAGRRQPAGQRRPGARSSSAPAACGTSSSPSSCSSSCTAGPTRRCAIPARCPRSPPWPPAGTWAGRTRRAWPRPTGSCGSSSTCCSCASCGGPTRCRPTPRSCARSAGRCAPCGMPTRTPPGSRRSRPTSRRTRRSS